MQYIYPLRRLHLSQLQDSINIKSKFNVPLCLVGDFNARTGLLADYLDTYDNGCI